MNLASMVPVSSTAARHIRLALSEDLDELLRIEKLDESDRPADFDVNDIWFTRDMVEEFQSARTIDPTNHSFQFAIAAVYGYVERHRAHLSLAEVDELFRLYVQVQALSILAAVPAGSAKRTLEQIISFAGHGAAEVR